MEAKKNYFKMFLLLAMAIGAFFFSKSFSEEKGEPRPVIIDTAATVINDNGISKIKTEVEIQNNGGKGYIVLEVKAAAENESWEKTINSYIKSKKTQKLQVIFDERNIADKNPQFEFNVYPFK